MLDADEMQKKQPYATFGSNALSDFTSAEFEAMLGHVHDVDFEVNATKSVASSLWSMPLEVPRSKDWTGTATTPVKAQGSCGSCWAFSATEQIESDFILQKGVRLVLAPQELVDCTWDGSERYGCGGGNPSAAYDVIKSLGGMELERSYPYIFDDYDNDVVNNAQNDITNDVDYTDDYYYYKPFQKCHFSKSKAKVTIAGYEAVGRGD